MQLLMLNGLKVSPSFIICFERSIKRLVSRVFSFLSSPTVCCRVPQASALKRGAHGCQEPHLPPHPRFDLWGELLRVGVIRECSGFRGTNICYHTMAFLSTELIKASTLLLLILVHFNVLIGILLFFISWLSYITFSNCIFV